jgi:hypothetical protein
MVTGGWVGRCFEKEGEAGGKRQCEKCKKVGKQKGVLSTSLKEVGKGDQGASPYIALAL